MVRPSAESFSRPLTDSESMEAGDGTPVGDDGVDIDGGGPGGGVADPPIANVVKFIPDSSLWDGVLNFTVASIWDITLGANLSGITFANPPDAGLDAKMEVTYRQPATGGPYTLAQPSVADWRDISGTSGGVPPAMPTADGAQLTVIFDVRDGGVTYGGSYDSASSGGGSGLPWFNVSDYGALGDGTTDDLSAINDAIDALNGSGAGVLYVPATPDGYLVSDALNTISANGMILGDGMGAYDGSSFGSAILCSSQTAVLFTIESDQLVVKDIGLFNTYGGTPSGGSGIEVSGSFIGQKVDLESVVISHFYVNIDRQVGAQWVNHNVWNWGAVLYGEHIENTVNQDAGDWSIAGCNYYADTYSGTAAIHQTGAGGGKIVATKINGHGGARYTVGIDAVIASTTSILMINGVSIENVSGDAVFVSGDMGYVTIAGLQVGLYGNNTGFAVKLSSGGVHHCVIDDLVARTDGTARAAVSLTSTSNVTLGLFVLHGFNARYTSSGDTGTVDGVALSYATPSIVLGSSAAAGAATTLIRSDATIAAFDATAPTTQAFGDTAATGSAAFAARRDHKHGMPAAPTGGSGQILIADTHSTPLIFADLIQTEAQDDLVYAD